MSNQGNRHPSRNEGPISDDSLSELLRPVAEFNASMDMQAYDWANMSGYPFPDNTDMLSGDPNRLFNGEQNWPRAFPDDMLVSVQTEHMFGLNDRDMFQMPAQNGISNRPVSQQRRNRRGTAAPVYQPPSSLYPPVLPYPSQPTNYPFLPILHPSPMYGGPPPPPYLGWNGTFSPEQPVQSTAVFDPSLPTTNPFVTAHNASMAPVLPVTPAGGIPKNAGARSNEVQLNSSAKSNTNTAPKCKKIKLESQTESDHSCLWVVSRDSFPQVICGQTFTSPRQLANHIHRGHIVPIDGLIHCSWQGCCKFRSHNYLNKAKVQRHVLGHAKHYEFVCTICSKGFTTKDQLNSHKNACGGLKPFPCLVPGCGKSSSTKTGQETHARTHSGEKPFFCFVCFHACNDQSNMRKHLKSKGHGTKFGRPEKKTN